MDAPESDSRGSPRLRSDPAQPQARCRWSTTRRGMRSPSPVAGGGTC